MGEVDKHHWGLPDPSAAGGDEAAIRSAFMKVIDRIEDKVDEWLRECEASMCADMNLGGPRSGHF